MKPLGNNLNYQTCNAKTTLHRELTLIVIQKVISDDTAGRDSEKALRINGQSRTLTGAVKCLAEIIARTLSV